MRIIQCVILFSFLFLGCTQDTKTANFDTQDTVSSVSDTETTKSTGDDVDFDGVIDAAAGFGHSCAIKKDGQLYCWGANQGGQIGTGVKNPYKAMPDPALVSEAGPWVDVCAGTYHSCAIKDEGSLWCWGQNMQGQLGTGDSNARLKPTKIGESSWKMVTCNNFDFTCAIKNDDSLWCWGDNNFGQLGVGTSGGPQVNADEKAPVLVSDEKWKYVATGGAHTCGLRDDNSLWCWGLNLNGRLGLGEPSTEDDPPLETTPQKVGDGWKMVSPGGGVTCAIDDVDELHCWGLNESGQVGAGDEGVDHPRPAIVGERKWIDVAAGGSHGCGIDEDGNAWCWGKDDVGQLAQSTWGGIENSPILVDEGHPLVRIFAGGEHTCALDSNGKLWCWGYNFKGQLGNGTWSEDPVPGVTQVDFF